MKKKTSTADKKLLVLQKELSERIFHFTSFIDISLGDGSAKAGNKLLESIQNSPIDIWGDLKNINLSRYHVGRALPFFYEYAYHARCIEGIDWVDWDLDYIDAIFREFLEITDTYGIVSAGNGDPGWGMLKTMAQDIYRKSPLWEMMELCDARHRLDFDDEILIDEIVILSGMNEKSVKNALNLEGENKLISEDGVWVKSTEALRWLQSRKTGFIKTTFVSFETDRLPEKLSYMEISPFIKSRVEKFYGDACEEFRFDQAAKLLNYTRDQLWGITEDVEKISVKDTHRIANVIKVDPAWFTEQVFSALFPEQMELILYKNRIEYKYLPDSQEQAHIDIVLTEKGIKNGYIDIPEKFSDFFPKDSFADRSKDEQGKLIELRFGKEVRNTDMCVKSSITISPRARFGSYLNKVVNAKPGDKIRFIRIEERIYELKFLSSINEPIS
ncbi:MAG: hypothetical protein K9L22_03795 [Methylococcaceae bacterium]|nr:hypothetical protein [Methylococcaceae bacterium]